ncbi:MAG: phosphodiester glycosidase family protein [Solirubrobacterales bacterium]
MDLGPTAGEHCERLRIGLDDGAATTVHVARFERARYEARVVAMRPPAALLGWCPANRVENAIVGGFFIRSDGTPLGELWLAGVRQTSQTFDPPWDATRGCLHLNGGGISLAARDELDPEPSGDLLQAGPLLVRARRTVIEPTVDPEGFSAGSRQFDSDITAGRYPRAALGLNDRDLIAVVCDGRSNQDAGMSLAELADTMVDLDAREAINLDGGGSASLIVGGALVNSPREEHGLALAGGRPVSTALAFRRH